MGFFHKRTWNKVFDIADPKTGTTSLGGAFRILGLKNKGWDPVLHEKVRNEDYEDVFRVVDEYESFEDAPWCHGEFYKLLDEKFPKSKFILLERDIDDWIKSHERHFSPAINANKIEKRFLIKDYDKKKKKMIEEHITRHQNVREYFHNRPDDLLVMNVCAGEGWEKLCPFLGLKIPKEKFPHLYKSKLG